MKSRNHIGGGMLICGLSRLTLLDYPEHVGATIFTGGCNFRCPFCQNGDLVLDQHRRSVYRKKRYLIS